MKFKTKLNVRSFKLMIVAAALVLPFLLSAQQTSGGRTLNPPTDLGYIVEDENDVSLYWTAPSTSTSTNLHWDSGENHDSFGFFLSAEHFATAAKWNPEHLTSYDTWTITSMRFYVVNPMPTITLKIWTGVDGTEVYSQPVTNYNFNDWTEVTLDTPVTIDASTHLWAGLDIDMPGPGGIMGIDEGPAFPGQGNMVLYGGTWYDDQIDANFNIQITVEEAAPAPTLLHWDDGENNDAFGFFLGAAQFSPAAKWNPEHLTNYDSWTINTMRFFVTNPMPTITLKIWTGVDGTEVYSQEVTDFNINEWTEVILTTPYVIDASTHLWAGLDIDMPVSGGVMGMDAGPAFIGHGDMTLYNGTWYTGPDFGVGANWNIQIEVAETDGRMERGLLGYNIYRNDDQVNQSLVTSLAYIDQNLQNGVYDYHVTAMYDEGESDPSNIVEVTIDQPVILESDSLVVVDIYNQCNGVNWNYSGNWFETPLNEWQGIRTTGNRVTGIFLSNNNLTGTLPESIGYLDALDTLMISSNELTNLPSNFTDLSSLEVCWISHNNITELPETIGNLTNLKEFHIGYLSLSELPDSFGNLASLEWLGLGDNQLTSLPDSFGNLASLQSCFIWGNQLTALPENFGNITTMKFLQFDDNQITALPESFGNLINVLKVFAGKNQLTALPESFGNLESLEYLSLEENQLETLPANFGDLDNMNFLRLSINNLSSLPASFSDLDAIERLYLDQNQLESIPEDFGNLTTLMDISMSDNQIINFPESMGNLNTFVLFANNNQITSLPETIGNMSNVQFLGLDGNFISNIPESIGNLNTLGYLGLSQNNITMLPETFGNLEADTVLLFDNQIKVLPASMFDNYYTFLWVDFNELQFGSLEPLMGKVTDFIYDPQWYIGEEETIYVSPGQNINHSIQVSGENNVYAWYKDNTLLTGQTTNTLTLTNVDDDDAGIYKLEVTNTTVSDLTLESFDIEVIVEECVPWEFTITASVHTIIIPGSANPSLDGEPLTADDWIGVFYLNDNNEEVCGGAVKWNVFGNAAITAYGDDPTTSDKDGFAAGEQFRWKMFQCNLQNEVQAVATYDLEMPDQGFFADFGSSKLNSLFDAYGQYFNMSQGWNGVSSYIVPANSSVEDIMAPVVNDLIIMRNLTQVYWPEEEINTIGDWDNTSGYAIKFTDDVTFDIYGSSMADKTLTVASGWSYLPVLSECDVDAITLFEANQDNIVLVQDLIGTQVYWPEMGVYSLQTLVPGKSYKIKANSEFELTFPECGEKMQPSLISRKNSINTPWGDLNMTPSSENVVVFAEALKIFETGDMVAAFNQNNVLCGMMEVSNTNHNQSMILFGDDPTTYDADGFTEGALVSYKLYRSSTGEEFELKVEYLTSMENSTGLYYSNSFAGITNMTTGITSVNEMSENNINLYPNPAKDHVNIEFATGNDYSANVTIFDAQGRIVMEEIISGGNTQINVSNLKQGVYIVRITTSNNNKTVKLVIE